MPFLLATFAFALLVAGFTQRNGFPPLHACLMAIGMAIDVSLVLTLEITKNAVGTALGPDMSLYQRIHIGASTGAVVLYFPVFVLGLIRLFKPSSSPRLRNAHRNLGYAALGLRTVGFAFMWTMLGRA
jgi:hypothetical protein